MKRLLVLLFCLFLCACTLDLPVPEPFGGIETMTPDTPTEPITPVEAPPDEIVRISFAAVGDNLVHPCIYIDARNRAVSGGRAYNFKPPYADILPLIEAADFAFINQETPLAGEKFGYSGYPNFNSPQDLGHDLVELGFDIINFATNHMLDKGANGYAGTIAFAKTLNATILGAYESVDDYNNIRIIEKDGFRVALLSYTQHTNYISLPKSSSLYVPYLSNGPVYTAGDGLADEELTRQVALAREMADAVIVSAHWGTDNGDYPDAVQKHYAQLMADLGVDVILGHHSHTVQPIVELTGKDGNKTLCIYSLGNLLSGMAEPKNMLGGVFGFELVSTNGEITFENVTFRPTVYWFGPSYYNGHIYLLEDYTAALHDGHGTYRQYGNYSTLDDMYRILWRSIDDQYLPEGLRSK